MDIKYRILDEQREVLKNISIDQFDRFANIEGQFEIVFDKINIGYVHEEIQFGDELLLNWFKKLNLVVNQLEKSNYVIFAVPDSFIWIEISKNNGQLLINEAEEKVNDIEFLISNVKYENIFKSKDIIDCIPEDVFFQCIEKNTENFIKEIKEINERLLKTKTISELIK